MAEPLSARAITALPFVAQPRWAPDGSALAWVEDRGDGVGVAVAGVSGTDLRRVVDAGGCARPHHTGGGAFVWCGVDRLLVVRPGGSLVRVAREGPEVVPIAMPDGRVLAPAVDPSGTRVALTLDRGSSQDIYVADIFGSRPATRISSGSDFTWDPQWSPDGTTVVWHEWDLPNMPWDGSRIAGRRVDGLEPTGPVRELAGGPTTAVAQPRYSPDGGRLAYLCDANGRMQVWVAHADGSHARPLAEESCEHGLPAWGSAAVAYVWSPDGTAIAYARNEGGFGALVRAEIGCASEPAPPPSSISRGWYFSLDWGEPGIVAVRSGARTPAQLVRVEPHADARATSLPPVVAIGRDALAEPRRVMWRAPDGTGIEGLLYGDVDAARDTARRPALIVELHGGPTSAAVVDWQPTAAFLHARGYLVLRPNPRGSTGRGRAFARALEGGWGDLDVGDVVAGITHAVEQGWCDPGRVAVIGGSAGGFTALLVALRAPDLLAAVVSSYPVVDLVGFSAATHRFESRYLDTLLGPLPAEVARYRERSPLTHADRITVPVLMFQGEDDAVVPVTETDRMVAALRGAGREVEYHVYAGEGHGFSASEVVRDQLERTVEFLDRHLGRRLGQVGD